MSHSVHIKTSAAITRKRLPTTLCLAQKQAPEASAKTVAAIMVSPFRGAIATVPLLHIQRRFDNSSVIS